MNELQKISPNIIISELLEKWPEIAQVMIKHRMNCVGCSMAPFEYLADALKIYHVPLPVFLVEIDQVIGQNGKE